MESFGSILESVFFERLIHGQIRAGFLFGLVVMFVAALMMSVWYMMYPDVHSYTCLSGICFCAGIAMIGGLIQTNTDVEDQEAGRYSKWGSGWDLWGDNIISNKFGQFVLTALIVFFFAASAYYFVEIPHQEAEARAAAAAAAKPAVHNAHHTASHASASAKHHTSESVTHRKPH